MLKRLLSVICLATFLSHCGGGGGYSSGGTSSTPAVQSSISNSVANSSLAPSSTPASSFSNNSSSAPSSVGTPVKISGKITYDFVPHKANHIGLDYSATVARPVRGATVELVNALNNVQSSTTTNDLGDYEFSVAANTDFKIRIKAESKSQVAPTWNFSIVDNTSSDAIYSIVGSMASSGSTDSVRNLHAASGWDLLSNSYSNLNRPGAPFAILDTFYTGMKRFNSFGNTSNFPKLVAHWSTKNKAVDGDITLGEIETTYYTNGHIYVLGDANNDIDEYDASTLLHEFGHYIEGYFSRSDSIGGTHSQGDALDMRVAFSEGFANAFSGIILASPFYEDASGSGQANGGAIDLSKKNRVYKGYHNEASIHSIFYNYYASSAGSKAADDATKIFSVLKSSAYVDAPAFASIFLFTEKLFAQEPDQQTAFSGLLTGQNIAGTDQYGANEVDTGGVPSSWPIYKSIQVDAATPVNVCSATYLMPATNEQAKQNKLGNSAFLKVNTLAPASYTISAAKMGGASAVSKPEIVVYQRGATVGYGKNASNDINNLIVNLQADTLIIEVYDVNNNDSKNTDNFTLCFDITVKKN